MKLCMAVLLRYCSHFVCLFIHLFHDYLGNELSISKKNAQVMGGNWNGNSKFKDGENRAKSVEVTDQKVGHFTCNGSRNQPSTRRISILVQNTLYTSESYSGDIWWINSGVGPPKNRIRIFWTFVSEVDLIENVVQKNKMATLPNDSDVYLWMTTW